IAEQREVGSFIVEIDGNGAVLSGRFGGVGHVASPCGWQSVWMRHGEHSVSKHQGAAGAGGRYHLIRWNLLAASGRMCRRPPTSIGAPYAVPQKTQHGV